jgi:hypothetical protein
VSVVVPTTMCAQSRPAGSRQLVSVSSNE